MLEFKAVKYKHIIAAMELNDRLEAGEATEEDLLIFAIDMVKNWDFKDADTGKKLKLGELQELTREQIDEVTEGFREAMEGTSVPKKTA
jgi:hypothetical protein